MKKVINFCVMNITVFLPKAFVLAQTVTDNTGGGGTSLANPLGRDTTLTGLLLDILNVIMIFAIPLIVFMIIYAGFLYVTAQGNESKVGQAHKALLYAIIGGVLILTADILLTVIQGTVDALRT